MQVALLEEAIGNLTNQILTLQNKNEELQQGKALYEDWNAQQAIEIKKLEEDIKDKESDFSTLQYFYMTQCCQLVDENSSLQNACITDENENTRIRETIERFLENQTTSLFDAPNLLLIVIIVAIMRMIDEHSQYKANYEELDIIFKPLTIAVGLIVAISTFGILIPMLSGIIENHGNLKRLWHAFIRPIIYVSRFLLMFLAAYATLQGMYAIGLQLLVILIVLAALTNPVIQFECLD